MINGQVSAARDDGTGLEPRVPLNILGSDGAFRTLAVVVDTGFTGTLTLPEAIASDLGLRYLPSREITLADGQTHLRPTCRAELLWHGQPIALRANVLGDKPMLGTGILSPCRLHIDLWLGGTVTIEEATPPSPAPVTA